MAIAYVNGTVGGDSGSGGLTITYTGTANNSLFLAATSYNGVTSVVDSNGTTWTIGSYTPAFILAYIINSPAISSVTIELGGTSGAAASAALGEYSGVSSVVGSFVTNQTTSSPWTISKTLTGSTNWLIAGGGVGNGSSSPTGVSALTGTLRNTGTSEESSFGTWFKAILADNTGSGSQTCAATLTGVGIAPLVTAVAIEISPSVGPVTPLRLLSSLGCGT